MAVYTITNVGTNKCLNVYGDNVTTNSLYDNREVNIWTSSGTVEQQWIVHSFDGSEPILSYINRLFGLNAYRASTEEYRCDIHKVQNNMDDAEVVFEAVTGGYKIKLKKWGKYLTVKENKNGAKVYWLAKSSSNYQVWKFTEQKIIESYTGTIYAKSGTSSTAPLTQEQMTTNATYIYNFLKKHGFTRESACGVLGNYQRESTMNPGIWFAENDTFEAYGIAQWRPGTKFINWAYDLGVITEATARAVNGLANGTAAQKKNLMNAELAFMMWYGTTGEGFSTEGGWTFDKYKQSTNTPGSLARIFNTYYENSGSDGELKAQYAGDWYNHFTQ